MPLTMDLSVRSQPLPTDATLKKAPAVAYHQSTHRLPYLAHQQLDPSYFPRALGKPCGGPKDEAPPGSTPAWDDDDSDAGAGADLESDADDDDFRPQKIKRAHQFESAKIANASEVKKMKLLGGRPAVAKKVTADLDSDDEIIVRMKEARYLEKDIAQALVDQGRTAYNPKTIGTRWRRIKVALQKRQDDLLDADLTDWHDGDDDVLLQAVLKAEKEVKRMKEDVEAKKWRIAADQLKSMKPVVNFSQNACRDRYEALQRGTAKPTPESWKNPTPAIRERIKSRKDKERKIAESVQLGTLLERGNVASNAWSSRTPAYL